MFVSKFLDIDIHDSWSDFFTSQMLRDIVKAEKIVGSDYTPDADNVLRFAQTDLNNLKVAILGQDPYKNGEATGRSFEVGGLTSWNGKVPRALQQILRAIYRTYKGELKSSKEIVAEINNGNFDIKSPDKLFQSWENQGVLLLNSSLTTRLGVSGEHMRIWEHITTAVVEYVSARRPDTTWILWGTARQKARFIGDGLIVADVHPSSYLANSDQLNFLQTDAFKITKEIINWTGSD